MSASAAGIQHMSLFLLGWLGTALLLGTFLAGMTWLLVKVLRLRAAPGLEAALWAIVLLKFLVPVGPEWSYSLPTVCGRMWETVPAGEVLRENLRAELEVRAVPVPAGVRYDTTVQE